MRRTGWAAAALAAGLALAGPGPAARADATGGTTGSGYSVTAEVHFSGDVAAGSAGTRSITVPAKCWWEPVSIPGLDASDPQAVMDWWEATMPTINGSFTVGRVIYGDAQMYEAAVAAAAAGQRLSFYGARCRSGSSIADLVGFTGRSVDVGPMNGGRLPVSYAFFAPGDPPQPLVDPADLARIAYERLDLVAPRLDRNPKIGGAVAATLVRLPTWFWVTDPDAVGGAAAGTRTVTARVDSVPPVEATVTARTDGVTITSDSADSTTCTVAQAQVRYRPGVPDSAACTLAFHRSSAGRPGGFTVTSHVGWNATWTSNDGDGGTLNGRFAESTLRVPVAESQAVVRDVG